MDKPLVSRSEKSAPPASNITNNKPKKDTTTQSSSLEEYKYEEPSRFRKFCYDTIVFILSNIFSCFFREIKSRNAYKIPSDGPIIFVAAPHANQFVDPVILMEQVKKVVNRRISFLIAEKSLHQPAIGFFARCVMAIGVVRAQDNLKLVPNGAKIFIKDPKENPRKITGVNTHFLTAFHAKGLIGLPKNMGTAEILSIESDTELTLRKEFKNFANKPDLQNLLLKGTSFKYTDKVNQSSVYHKVFEHLANNDCIGIFPEGGSHDRTDLLPLKAGVAIMALGCMDKHPDVNVKIVPCGMNYFHAHKFRSRGVVEFGDPIDIPKELAAKYSNSDTNKEAVKELLDTISEGLRAVTVTCSDYETLMVVQAMRRLYSAHFASKLPLPLIVEMNRKMVKGYETYRDDPVVIKLREDVMKYNANLSHYNIPDHQVEDAKMSFTTNLGLLVYRAIFLTITFILALPGIIMFSPVFILANRISKRKAREALAASSVKIKANDVIATWKILIGMGAAPLLYIFWSVLISYYFSKRGSTYDKIFLFVSTYICCVIVTYSALIVGDLGMDILKSLRPLYLSLTSPKALKELRNERELLAARIIEVVNTFGTELFPEFQPELLREEYGSDEDTKEDRKTAELKRRRLLKKKRAKMERRKQENENSDDNIDNHGQESDGVSLVNSDNSLSNIPIFSTPTGFGSEISITRSDSSVSDFEIEDDVIGGKGNLAAKIAQAVLNSRSQQNEHID
ncbi:bifunctional glycerol-3-phosphate/glycerone-phosphate O-acyltransferase SCT1 NDAI_0A03280 [Naumovozyma dairenensis CBS 421]|uniref:Phospholipid/glycerol acyltransferase domain-containing protein n=1 Tax=Naumovozyma dairenensis (strain ATCC 10597 / BCRC 20456 / CBS 421 / NBRC 0211 / NRRL Y-12639) TaxID=1071378 RepID=G0W3U7_NAUDC|nr:hypothetical protein NDAI_0A03280 [Naumovozyma dairenensis CBS 421]CCD22485.1 hypothetical protein NDAI_0A03280 [Naumovozyma dairenensis CBS 421]